MNFCIGTVPLSHHSKPSPPQLPHPELQLSLTHSLSCGPTLQALIPTAGILVAGSQPWFLTHHLVGSRAVPSWTSFAQHIPLLLKFSWFSDSQPCPWARDSTGEKPQPQSLPRGGGGERGAYLKEVSFLGSGEGPCPKQTSVP